MNLKKIVAAVAVSSLVVGGVVLTTALPAMAVSTVGSSADNPIITTSQISEATWTNGTPDPTTCTVTDTGVSTVTTPGKAATSHPEWKWLVEFKEVQNVKWNGNAPQYLTDGSWGKVPQNLVDAAHFDPRQYTPNHVYTDNLPGGLYNLDNKHAPYTWQYLYKISDQGTLESSPFAEGGIKGDTVNVSNNDATKTTTVTTYYAYPHQASDCGIPQACVATGDWYTENTAPDQGQYGLIFSGPSVPPINWLHPTSGNLQGITTTSYTISAATGYQAAYRFVLYATGTSGYTSVSAEPYMNGWVAGQTGTFTVTQSTLVWNSHITSGPGSQSQPVTLAAMAALIPNNQMISQGFHLGSNSAGGTSSMVSAVTGCLNVSFVPTVPNPVSGNVVTEQQVCDSASVTVTTTPWTQEYVWKDGAYVLGAKVDGTPVVTHRALTSDEALTCAGVKPEPKSGTDTTKLCDATSLVTTSTSWTQEYVLSGTKWVLGDKVSADPVVETSPADAACATTVITPKTPDTQLPTPKALAFTGANGGLIEGGALVALFLLLGGAGAILYSRKVSKN